MLRDRSFSQNYSFKIEMMKKMDQALKIQLALE
jgi:hypothetical protein